jgi:carbon storage regulator
MQSVRIGADVRITVVKVDRTHVRLGIEAPRHVTVLRAELLEDDSADGATPEPTSARNRRPSA